MTTMLVALSICALMACKATPSSADTDSGATAGLAKGGLSAADPEAPPSTTPTDVPRADPIAGWLAYAGPGKAYTVKLPGSPEEATSDLPIGDIGVGTLTTAVAVSEDGKHIYATAVAEVRVSSGAVFDQGLAIKTAIDRTLANGSQDAAKDIVVGGIAGREVTFRKTWGVPVTGTMRAFAADHPPRLWMVTGAAAIGESKADIQPFIDSFVPVAGPASAE